MSSSTLRLAVAPHDHTRFCDSAVALAGRIRSMLSEPRTLDEIHALLRRPDAAWPGEPTLAQIALAATLLHAIRAAEAVGDDRIVAASP